MTLEILIDQTASSGTWSFNTQKFKDNVYLRQIIVKAATSDTSFDFYIQDDNDNYVFDTRVGDIPAVGTLRREVDIPLLGIHTVSVVSSTADEAFTGKLMIEEGGRK